MSNLKITCPNCQVTNRIPTNRIADKPSCGKCKKPVFTGRPFDIKTSNVAAIVNHNELPVVVDCWAPWCGPCKSFASIYTKVAAGLETKARFAKLNTENNQVVAGRWKIRSIPTLIIFKQGKEVDRVAGSLSQTQLKQWLKKNGIG